MSFGAPGELRVDDDGVVGGGTRLTPDALHELVAERGDDVVFFDGRNALEAAIGRFRGAVVPDVETTRDFVELLDSGEYDELKGRPVVTYCTGGIRCEVLSSLMASRGFGEVYQLEGGIVRYGERYRRRRPVGGLALRLRRARLGRLQRRRRGDRPLRRLRCADEAHRQLPGCRVPHAVRRVRVVRHGRLCGARGGAGCERRGGAVTDAPGSARSSIVLRADGRVESELLGTPEAGGAEALTATHRFDLASLTKLYTAVAALTFVDAGDLDLDEPLHPTLSVGRGPGAHLITARHLLLHTSGLPAGCEGWRDGVVGDALLDTALASPLSSRPGERHLYSCVGYLAVGVVLERLAAQPLDRIIEERVLRPLGADRTGYGPVPAGSAVATEFQANRGTVRGQVHDELAHHIGRPVGNAGLFATADDVLLLAAAVLDRGEARHGRVLRAASAELLVTPLAESGAYRQAIGFRVGDRSFMPSDDAVGHTGFTGTSVVLDPVAHTASVLLTNRVHPTREADIAPARREFHEHAARADATPTSA